MKIEVGTVVTHKVSGTEGRVEIIHPTAHEKYFIKWANGAGEWYSAHGFLITKAPDQLSPGDIFTRNGIRYRIVDVIGDVDDWFQITAEQIGTREIHLRHYNRVRVEIEK